MLATNTPQQNQRTIAPRCRTAKATIFIGEREKGYRPRHSGGRGGAMGGVVGGVGGRITDDTEDKEVASPTASSTGPRMTMRRLLRRQRVTFPFSLGRHHI